MGPEDPAADACVALVISGCSEVAKLINENIQGSDRICGAIGACGGSEAGASEAVGGVFEESAATDTPTLFIEPIANLTSTNDPRADLSSRGRNTLCKNDCNGKGKGGWLLRRAVLVPPWYITCT